jgi:hypothetical protein
MLRFHLGFMQVSQMLTPLLCHQIRGAQPSQVQPFGERAVIARRKGRERLLSLTAEPPA